MSEYSNFTTTTFARAGATTASVVFPSGETVTISTTSDVLHISSLVDLFRRLALAAGYSPEVVNDYMGEGEDEHSG